MNEKLMEIQERARFYNSELEREFGKERVSRIINGGNFLLGCNEYGESDKIYLSFNPGADQGAKEFNVEYASFNIPWGEPDTGDHFPFWEKGYKFFNISKGFREWIDKATSAFLIPWRTDSASAFDRDKELKKRIYKYSGELVQMMIDHHEAKSLIIAGKDTLKVLASDAFLRINLNDYPETKENSFDLYGVYGAKGAYECRIIQLRNGVSIYQIPHFSRGQERGLQECARWMWGKISGNDYETQLPSNKSDDTNEPPIKKKAAKKYGPNESNPEKLLMKPGDTDKNGFYLKVRKWNQSDTKCYSIWASPAGLRLRLSHDYRDYKGNTLMWGKSSELSILCSRLDELITLD